MTIRSTKEPWLLVAGDLMVMAAALYGALAIRSVSVPSTETFMLHAVPFSLIWAASILIYFIVGAYERHTALSVLSFTARSIQAAIVIAALSITLFYLIPFFGVTPKTTLFVYLLVFVAAHIGWRVLVSTLLLSRTKMPVVLIAEGADADAFVTELERNANIPLSTGAHISPNDTNTAILSQLLEVQQKGGIVIVDSHHPAISSILPQIYECLLHKCIVVDFVSVYGEVFNRLPLGTLSYAWLFEHITVRPKPVYDVFKRLFDCIVGGMGSIAFFIVYPFAACALKLQDGGPVFFFQERVGKNGAIIKIRKFRSSSPDGSIRVTKVGAFLRKSRIDELPQLLDVLEGKLSLVGPRPEMVPLVSHYTEHVPYYDVRHLVAPGLFGWAQVYHENHPHHNADVEETHNKVSYDLYYIMHRSFIMDITIVFKTIPVLLSRSGR